MCLLFNHEQLSTIQTIRSASYVPVILYLIYVSSLRISKNQDYSTLA